LNLAVAEANGAGLVEENETGDRRQTPQEDNAQNQKAAAEVPKQRRFKNP
jgi:hypothetical protein